jgi:hypothetical protein
VSGSLITSWQIEQANSAIQVSRKKFLLENSHGTLNSRKPDTTKIKECIKKYNITKDNLSAAFQPQTSEHTLPFSGPAC